MSKTQSELELDSTPEPQKKGGRPDRQVTRENFFGVLQYFRKRRDWDEELSKIERDAPWEPHTPEALEKDLAYAERRKRSAIKRGDLTGRYGASEVEKEIESLKGRSTKPVTDGHIDRLQSWVLDGVSKEEWARACSAIRQSKFKEKHGHFATAQIPVRRETKWKLDRMKKHLGSTDWTTALEKIMELAEEGLRTLEARKRAKETRKRNKAERRY